MKILITILLLLPSLSAANVKTIKGDWGSGGGNAVVCFNSTTMVKKVIENDYIITDDQLKYIHSIEMYDLYEAKKRRGINSTPVEIIKIKENEKIYSYIERVFGRFTFLVDDIGMIMHDGRELLPDENFVFHSAAVKRQNDIGSVVLPSNKCLIITMAAQLSRGSHFEVHVDDRLYNHKYHSKQSRAIMVMHELIYAIGRHKFHHKDSKGTRGLVGKIITYHESVNQGSVSKLLYDMHFVDQHYTGMIERAYYQNATIMEGIEFFTIATLGDMNIQLRTDFKEEYPEFTVLYDAMLNQFCSINTCDEDYPVHYNEILTKSIFSGSKILNLGLMLDRQNSQKWETFKKDFAKAEEKFHQYTEKIIDDVGESLLLSYKKINTINSSQILYLENYIISYFKWYLWTKLTWGEIEHIELGLLGIYDNDQAEVYRLVYEIFTHSIPTNNGTLSPFKLNNQIPKQFVMPPN